MDTLLLHGTVICKMSSFPPGAAQYILASGGACRACTENGGPYNAWIHDTGEPTNTFFFFLGVYSQQPLCLMCA